MLKMEISQEIYDENKHDYKFFVLFFVLMFSGIRMHRIKNTEFIGNEQ